MNDNVYAVTEVVGSSRKSVEDAIQNAISVASRQLKLLEWFEVVETRGHIEDGRVGHYQVVLKLGSRHPEG